MTFINKMLVRGNDPDDNQIDIEATAEGKLEVVAELNTPIEGLVKAGEYTFTSSLKRVVVDDDNVDFVYSIYNQTLDKMLYIINSESFSGVLMGGSSVTYNNTVASVADTDTLIIFYIKNGLSVEEVSFKNMIVELKSIGDKLDINNKYLKKIYNPE